MIAAGAALIGVVVGKYYIFALLLKAAITDALGAQTAAAFTLFSLPPLTSSRKIRERL